MRNKRRPYQVLMDEQVADSGLWDLDTHIAGCFAGYQQNQGFGTAVYFALEMLSGIAVQGTHLEAKGLTKKLISPDGSLRPDAAFTVPWFCIASLAAAWESYKEMGPPLGKAFRLEGSQGRIPVIERLERTLDYRALARFVWDAVFLAGSGGPIPALPK